MTKCINNVYGIRIPSSLLKSLDLKTNDIVELIQLDDAIIISKPKKKHLTLEDRIVMYEKTPVIEKGSIESYNWGEDVGKEIID